MDKRFTCPRCLKNLHHGVHTCTPTKEFGALEYEVETLREQLATVTAERDDLDRRATEYARANDRQAKQLAAMTTERAELLRGIVERDNEIETLREQLAAMRIISESVIGVNDGENMAVGRIEFFAHLQEQLAACQKECSSLNSDAERYRWLRDQMSEQQYRWFIEENPQENWDAAIDAAMEEQPK